MALNAKNTPQGVFATTYSSVAENATYSLELPIGFTSILIIASLTIIVKI